MEGQNGCFYLYVASKKKNHNLLFQIHVKLEILVQNNVTPFVFHNVKIHTNSICKEQILKKISPGLY